MKLAHWYWLLALGVITAIVYDETHPYACVDEGVVKEILAVNYRSATFLLEDGRTIDLSQATLKPGDTTCLKRER